MRTLLKPVALCLTVSPSGCATVADPSFCKYSHERSIGADTETDLGTARERAAPFVGTYHARPVWVIADGGRPSPGLLDELVIATQLAKGRVHRLLDDLEPSSSAWCPAQRLDPALTLQIRSADGSFWAARPDGSPSVWVIGYDQPGLGGPFGGGFPVQRHPADWDDLVADLTGVTPSAYTFTTTVPSTYNGLLPEARTDSMQIGVTATVFDADADQEVPVPLFEAFVWDLEAL